MKNILKKVIKNRRGLALTASLRRFVYTQKYSQNYFASFVLLLRISRKLHSVAMM